MPSLMEEFLNGAQRVTAEVLYFIPLREGDAPRRISTGLLKDGTREVAHTNLLQTFVNQFDDKPDIQDTRLYRVFQELVADRGGVVRIQDRRERLSLMTKEAAVAPIFIPRPEEELNAGMKEIVDTFKTMIPFPRVRKFL